MYTFGAVRSATPLSPRPQGKRFDALKYADGVSEPSLNEVLADPVVHAVMARDSVSRETLIGHIKAAQAKIENRRLFQTTKSRAA